MPRPGLRDLRVGLAFLAGALLLVGAVACGDDDERTGTQIEWHPGTPGPSALTPSPTNPTAPPAG